MYRFKYLIKYIYTLKNSLLDIQEKGISNKKFINREGDAKKAKGER